MTTTIDSPVTAAPNPVRLRDLAFAALAASVEGHTVLAEPEMRFLILARARIAAARGQWPAAVSQALHAPTETDERLVKLGHALSFTPLEFLTVALAAATEDDALVGRALARLQSPVGGARPTLGLLATVFPTAVGGNGSTYASLLNGAAVKSGLLLLLNDVAPLPERSVAVPLPLCLALAGHESDWPGVTIGTPDVPSVALAASLLDEAGRRAATLGEAADGLVIRSGWPAEGRAMAKVIARQLGRQAAFIETDKVASLGLWLRLRDLLPVFVLELGPSERRLLSALPGYDGPFLVLAGPDGGVETAHGALPTWQLPVPSVKERKALWRASLGSEARELAYELARNHRHGAGCISQVGRLARQHAALRGGKRAGAKISLEKADVLAASWSAGGGGLDSMAEPIRTLVPDEALVVPARLRAQLELLVARCRARDGLVERLGLSATTRYRPGVRVLFTGPSGTGKTLAASWMATQLGLPLYRADLANLTSKYIGETEKNLAQLLARAEQAEIVLLFDEADSLFGKRTDIRDSNDRFANAQTNYLLQRIESYDGIVLLTSNNRSRFDSAFARRLDCVLEFHLPSPDECRALWRAHLGQHHELKPAELNQLAALADVSGGHIRNAVLTAALVARGRGRSIRLADCVRGLELEYRKVDRPLPSELEAVLNGKEHRTSVRPPKLQRI